MMNEKYRLLEVLSAAEFAAWETRLYLDTHPCDAQAIAMGREYAERAAALRAEYEKRYGSLTGCFGECDDKWKWICDPWPWDCVKGE